MLHLYTESTVESGCEKEILASVFVSQEEQTSIIRNRSNTKHSNSSSVAAPKVERVAGDNCSVNV